jgi:tetratricopeptide (TPR) repeat protein
MKNVANSLCSILMKYKFFFFSSITFLLFLTNVHSVHCQQKYLTKGDKSFEKYKFDKAIRKYKKAYVIDSSYQAAKKLAFAYQANYELELATDYYETALKHPNKEIQLHLSYAEFLASYRRYSSSKIQLDTFLSVIKDDKKANMLNHYLIERETYDCNPVAATNDRLFYCVTLNAFESIDKEMPHLIFRWNFDDNTELDGVIVNHCFGRSGIHTVALSTLDTLTNYQSSVDTVFTLDLSEQLNFKTLGSTVKGAEITFDASALNDIDDLHGLLWDLGDGNFESGDVVTHKYTKQGLYRTRLYVLTNINGKIEVLGCVVKPIFINKPILNIGRR